MKKADRTKTDKRTTRDKLSLSAIGRTEVFVRLAGFRPASASCEIGQATLGDVRGSVASEDYQQQAISPQFIKGKAGKPFVFQV